MKDLVGHVNALSFYFSSKGKPLTLERVNMVKFAL